MADYRRILVVSQATLLTTENPKPDVIIGGENGAFVMLLI